MNNDTPGTNPGIPENDEYSLESILAEYRSWPAPSYTTPKAPAAAAAPEKPAAVSAAAGSKAPAMETREAVSPAPKKPAGKVSGSIRDFMSHFTEEDYTRMAAADRAEQEAEAAAPAQEGAVPAAPVEIPAFDKGFLMGDNAPESFSYGGSTVKAEADSDYIPPEQTAESIVAVKKDTVPAPKLRRPVPDRDKAAAARSVSGEPEGLDVEDAEDVPAEEFPSFGEFIRSGIHNLTTSVGWFFAQLTAKIGTFTVEDPVEEEGPEARPAAASDYYRGFIRPMRLRLRISLVLLVFMAWLSFRLPVTGYFKDLRVTALMCMCFQLTIMLACLDTFTTGIMNAVRKRPGAESLAALFCIITTLDAYLTGKMKVSTAHVTLCLLSSIALFGATYASYLSVRALNKSYIIPKKAKSIFAVTAEYDDKGAVTLRRTDRSYGGFIRRSEEAAPDETRYIRFFLPAVCAALFFSLIVAIAKRNLRDFFYIYSVLLCPTIPFTALLCFAWPYFTGAFRMFKSSSCIAGWSGVCDTGRSKTLIITDADLFPAGTVKLGTVRTMQGYPAKRVISYAGTMLAAAGTSLAAPFVELMEEQHCSLCSMEAFEPLPSGGMKAVVDGSVILLGGSEVMHLMGVRIPQAAMQTNIVCLSVNGILRGYFELEYTRDEKVRKALRELMRSSRHPIFAPRDFNITPDLLSRVFDLPTGGYDFPPYLERYTLTERDGDSTAPVTALISCTGLSRITRMAETGHAIYTVTRINMALNALAAVSGMLVLFSKLLGSGVSVLYIFLYLLVFALPVAVLSVLLPRI